MHGQQNIKIKIFIDTFPLENDGKRTLSHETGRSAVLGCEKEQDRQTLTQTVVSLLCLVKVGALK